MNGWEWAGLIAIWVLAVIAWERWGPRSHDEWP